MRAGLRPGRATVAVLAMGLITSVANADQPPRVAGSEALLKAFDIFCLQSLPNFARAPDLLRAAGFRLTPFADPGEWEFHHPHSNLSGAVSVGGLYKGGCTMKSPTAPKQDTVNGARKLLRSHSGHDPELWLYSGTESGWFAPGHGKTIYVIFSGGEGNSGDGRGTGLSAGLRDE